MRFENILQIQRFALKIMEGSVENMIQYNSKLVNFE